MKEKISITLDEKIVNKIEDIAKKQGINRSKFIESILIEKLENTPILILAGWSEIENSPKSLLEYKKRKIIVEQIESLQNQGFNNIYVSVSSNELKDFLENNLPHIKIIFEDKKIGSGGTLKRFGRLIGTRFMFIYGDILTDLDFNKLSNFHIREKSDLALVLKTSKETSKYGNARMEGNRIISFEEKPKNTETFLIYTGMGAADPSGTELLDDEGKFEFQLDKIKKKVGYIYEGYWKSFEEKSDFN